MKGERLGEHRTRDEIVDLVAREPGISFGQIVASLQMNKGTLRYHIGILLNRGSIFSEMDGRESIFFRGREEGRSGTKGRKVATRIEKRVIALIEDRSGIGRSEIARRAGSSKKEVLSMTRRLEKDGRIWKVRTEEGTGFEIVDERTMMERMYLELVHLFMDGTIDEGQFLATKRKLDLRSKRK